MSPKTLYDKIWDAHVVHEADDGTCLLYIDRHLVHEVTSPQAFEGLRMTGRTVRAPDKTIAVPDHNVPTTAGRDKRIDNEESRIQVEALDKNAKDFGINYYPVSDIRQGIVHIVGPEQGWTLPGMTVVCGDWHTATHGAFGALAHGIGTSEVEHVLATQTLIQQKSKNMKVEITGKLRPGVTAKDITLSVIGATGTAGGTGHVIEYCGEAIRDLSMEGRMTVCNMAIEGGARAGPDRAGREDLRLCDGPARMRRRGPRGKPRWPGGRRSTPTRARISTRCVTLRGEDIAPVVTWGTSPEDVLPITGVVPAPERLHRRQGRGGAAQPGLHGPDAGPEAERHRHRHGLHRLLHQRPDRGSARGGGDPEGQEDQGRMRAMVVPGSGLVRAQAEEEGLAQIFIDAGFEWRLAGCSMCLAMNPDQLSPGERCAATSNRNFEGRQGRGGRTHLLSPGDGGGGGGDGASDRCARDD